MISSFPCNGDSSIAYLCSFVNPNYIIILWTALLLEKSVIICVDDPNMFYYIVKGLILLMFPFDWQHAKGLINDFELINSPFPYCFGILNSAIGPHKDLTEILDFNKIFILKISEKKQDILITNEKEMVKFPYASKLKAGIEDLCNKYNLIHKENKSNLKYLGFSRRPVSSGPADDRQIRPVVSRSLKGCFFFYVGCLYLIRNEVKLFFFPFCLQDQSVPDANPER